MAREHRIEQNTISCPRCNSSQIHIEICDGAWNDSDKFVFVECNQCSLGHNTVWMFNKHKPFNIAIEETKRNCIGIMLEWKKSDIDVSIKF